MFVGFWDDINIRINISFVH